jgi:hypothetical protein
LWPEQCAIMPPSEKQTNEFQTGQVMMHYERPTLSNIGRIITQCRNCLTHLASNICVIIWPSNTN